MKKKSSILLLLILMISTYSYAGWSNLVTVKVKRNQCWVRYSGIKSKKETTSSNWDLHVAETSMWSNPHIKLVNANGDTRSNMLSGSKGSHKGDGNTGKVGNTLYAAIKPAWNQTGEDTIRLEVNAR